MNNSLSYIHRILWVVVICLYLTGNSFAAETEKQLFEPYKSVIALDPGHGGNDFGARGPDGTAEKTVALNLARILAADLKRDYRVVLTRTDDHQTDLTTRTAIANHHQATLFISIHTGGSFVQSTTGIAIFHYDDFNEKQESNAGSAASLRRDNTTPILWDRAQNFHLENSRTLARLIHTRLNDLDTVEKSRIQGAPMAVLQGANMPAVLIEIGYLTNPAVEKKFHDQRFLAEIALAIRRGINEYFDPE